VIPARPPAGLDPSADELVRDARECYETLRADRRSRLALALSATAVTAGIAASAIFVHGGPRFSLATTVVFVVLYAVVSRVEFEIGAGSAIPTQLVLVPMLFALPIGLGPLIVTISLLLRATPDRPWPLLEPERVFSHVSMAAHSLGPVLVIGLGGGLPLRWSAWPIYVGALGAQFGFDFANALVNALTYRVRPRALVGFVGLAYAVDAALAPIGLAVAFAARHHVLLSLLSVPLVGVLAYFARERRLRIDNALELSNAYRGTAFLLGDVIEAEDAYTGSHSRHVVELVLAVCDELALEPAQRATPSSPRCSTTSARSASRPSCCTRRPRSTRTSGR
jgi:hypothetical protein